MGHAIGYRHIGCLKQMACVFQAAVADKVCHITVVTALCKSIAYLHGGQIETAADSLTIEQRIEI